MNLGTLALFPTHLSHVLALQYYDKELSAAINPIPYIVEETVKLTWDGRQFILRIPKEIAEEAGITQENQVKFKFIKFPPESDEKTELEISVL